ncbi:hypothetical protein M885DRAFT_567284 [Pelagophyceae sp. CCMP2097]|nr:hypothetical protein M885DRAFT_567284 [Pelagophyceae sp. CCMP2097]
MAAFPAGAADVVVEGVVAGACIGVHILRARVDEESWALSVHDFVEEDFGLEPGDMVPDLSLDPDDGVLSVINMTASHRAYHITLADAEAYGSQGTRLERDVLTFALHVPPRVVVDVCRVDLGGRRVDEISIASDVVDVVPPPVPAAAAPSESYAFPLCGESFLCTQAAGGGLSHFAHASTYHAVDFRCAVGTPVLAVAAGSVLALEVAETRGGVHVSALFAWNRVALKLDDGAVVEYVHVRADSALVSVGDRVSAGQQLCESGDVGFCPEPHLHIEMHLSTDADAPSVPFALRRRDGSHAVPEAGQWWTP